MPTNLQIRRGLQSALPTGLAGEPLFTTDTKRLYISDGTATNLLQGAATLLTTGAIPFSDANGKLTMNASSFYWDNTNARLGIGTASPDRPLHINSASVSALRIDTTGSGSAIYFGNSSALIRWSNGSYFSNTGMYSGVADQQYTTFDGTNTQVRLQIKASNGNIGIGTTTDAGYRLDVVGTDARINTLTIGLGGGQVSTNTALGFSALNKNTTGFENTAIGTQALGDNTIGEASTAVGYYALQKNTTGNNNSAFGYASLLSNLTTSNHTAIGTSSLRNITSGSYNIAFGVNAGRYIADGTTNLTTCNTSIFIGAISKPLANSQTNQIVIGYNAIGAGSNTATLGNTSIVDTILRGRVNIQQYATGSRPTYVKGALIYDSTLGKLVVGGNAGWEVVTSA